MRGRWRGDDATATRRRRRGDDGARTTARRRRGHGDDCGQVLAITTSASMTRARQHGDDGAATTRRARGGHDNAGLTPILTPILLRSSLRSSPCLPKNHPGNPPLHFDPHSHPPHSLRPSLRSQAGPRSLEVATESESDCHPARRIRCRSRGPRTRNSLACMAAAPIPGPLPSPHREAATNAVNGRVNKVVDLGWKT